jgi:hypothetical protein
MAFTTAQRDALKAAIAGGVREVTHDGKTVIYRSLEEMQQTLSMIEEELNAAAGTTPTRQIRAYSTKGF